MAAKQCQAKTARGIQCGSYALKGSKYCFVHNPSSGAMAAAARKKGGQHRRAPHAGNLTSLPEEVRSVEQVYRVLDYTLAETIALTNSILRSRALIAISEAYLKAISVGEFETRLTKLEEITNANQP